MMIVSVVVLNNDCSCRCCFLQNVDSSRSCPRPRRPVLVVVVVVRMVVAVADADGVPLGHLVSISKLPSP